jgi:hypothetical protein
MVGGNWQLDAEAAFNRLDQIGYLYIGRYRGAFCDPFPSGTGGRDRGPLRGDPQLTTARWRTACRCSSARRRVLEAVQTGSAGLSRSFWRPKGSATLAWTPTQGSTFAQAARTVGQLRSAISSPT